MKWDTEEKRYEVAKLCRNRREYSRKYSCAYKYSSKEELQKIFGNKSVLRDRFIYSYKFSDNSIYIGLTCNVRGRHLNHINNGGTVFDKIKEDKEIPIYNLLITNPISEEDVGELEDFIIEEYRSMGYNIINKVKGGSLGGGILKWTEEKLKNEALKYSNRGDFLKHSKNAYSKAHKYNLLNNICSHMPLSKGKWNKETVKNESKKYLKKYHFQKNSPGAYIFALKNNLLNNLYPCQVLEK